MRYSFIGKDTVVSDAIKQITIQKLSKLEKFIPDDTQVTVTYKVVKLDNKVEVTIPLKKRILRGESVDIDMYAAIDNVADILEKQIQKYKGRLRSKVKKDNSFKEEFITSFSEEDLDLNSDEKDKIEIKKIKRFDIKPMDVEEAVMEMELTNHNFFVFRNSESEEVNVVYKRNNNSYGIIEVDY